MYWENMALGLDKKLQISGEESYYNDIQMTRPGVTSWVSKLNVGGLPSGAALWRPRQQLVPQQTCKPDNPDMILDGINHGPTPPLNYLWFHLSFVCLF